MRTWFGVGLAILSGLGGCVREKPRVSAPETHYVVPPPWQGDRGVWFYPSARFGGSFSGLAVPMTAASAGVRTADGAAFDPAEPAAAVQSLQLPVVLRVTNLDNGRRMLVRADDRGPADPGRVVALDAAAMRRLGMSGVTAVSVAIDPALSEALADRFDALPRATETAPLDRVTSVPLGPPGAPAPAPSAAPVAASGGAGRRSDTVTVPSTVETVPVDAAELTLDAGTFSGADAARSVAAKVGGIASAAGGGRHPEWHVTRGPFATVAEADAALDQAEAAGISGARIVARDPVDSAGEAVAP